MDIKKVNPPVSCLTTILPYFEYALSWYFLESLYRGIIFPLLLVGWGELLDTKLSKKIRSTFKIGKMKRACRTLLELLIEKAKSIILK